MVTTTAYTFALVALAEIGDRSQLVCMALASRHRAAHVLLGAFIAFASMNLAAAGFGAVLTEVIGQGWTLTGSGLAMIGFGVWTWFDEADDEEDPEIPVAWRVATRPILGSTLALLMAELGDKTQVAVASLAAVEHPFAIWTGATLALFTTSALAVGLGRLLYELADPVIVRRTAAVFFGVTGLTMLAMLWW